MRTLRALWRLLRAVLHGLHGLAIVWLRFPSLAAAGRQARVQWWSAKLLRLLGMRLEVQGRFRAGAKLIVAKLTSRIAMVQTLGGAVRVLYSVSKLSSGNQVVCLMAPLIGPLITFKCP